MEIHFETFWTEDYYFEDCCVEFFYDTTLEMINERRPYIRTTQMALLSTDLIAKGYRIFVHDKDGEYEIKLGGGNERTNKDLRMEHNILKMWLAGEFNK